MNNYLLSVLLIVVMAFAAVFMRGSVRPYFLMLFVSTAYYAIGGPLYWTILMDGQFIGVTWGDEIYRAATYVIVSSAMLVGWTIFIRAFAMRQSTSNSYSAMEQNDEASLKWRRILRKTFILIGTAALCCACYVAAFIIFGDGNLSRDPFLLIAYQVSDAAIPCILFAIAMDGFKPRNVALLLLFIAYAAAIGFRYKIILIIFPILWLALVADDGTRSNRWIRAGFIAGCIVVMFSLLTITRSKFAGLDLSSLESATFQDSVYGLFAETNSLFGLIGVIRESIDVGNLIWFQPIVDALLELIPRFLYPDRVTGEYLATPLGHLVVKEALDSATAYPLVGELLLMGGYYGVALGTLVWALLINKFGAQMDRVRPFHARLATLGAGLSAVFFGYYAFSRGYFPQIAKGIIFVMLPFAFFSYCWFRQLGRPRT